MIIDFFKKREYVEWDDFKQRLSFLSHLSKTQHKKITKIVGISS
jgi:hypothetical protein